MTNMTFDTAESQASYGIGLELGQQLKGGGLKDFLVPEAILAGIKDSLSESMPAVEINVIHNALRELQQRSEPVRQNIQKQAEEKGRVFLVENAKKPGVITTASGLQYRVLTEGNGPHPTATDKVKVHYTGMNVDGQVFDSTTASGEPMEFVVGSSVAGLQEAIQLMSVGSRYAFCIPPEIGYGEKNGGTLLPPNSTLIFEIELLEIVS